VICSRRLKQKVLATRKLEPGLLKKEQQTMTRTETADSKKKKRAGTAAGSERKREPRRWE
jgi:hypothetical protein